MGECHGDENLIDVDGVEYDEGDYFDSLEQNIDLSTDTFIELADSTHPLDSPEWHKQAASVFKRLIETAKNDAQESAELRYMEQAA